MFIFTPLSRGRDCDFRIKPGDLVSGAEFF